MTFDALSIICQPQRISFAPIFILFAADSLSVPSSSNSRSMRVAITTFPFSMRMGADSTHQVAGREALPQSTPSRARSGTHSDMAWGGRNFAVSTCQSARKSAVVIMTKTPTFATTFIE